MKSSKYKKYNVNRAVIENLYFSNCFVDNLLETSYYLILFNFEYICKNFIKLTRGNVYSSDITKKQPNDFNKWNFSHKDIENTLYVSDTYINRYKLKNNPNFMFKYIFHIKSSNPKLKKYVSYYIYVNSTIDFITSSNKVNYNIDFFITQNMIKTNYEYVTLRLFENKNKEIEIFHYTKNTIERSGNIFEMMMCYDNKYTLNDFTSNQLSNFAILEQKTIDGEEILYLGNKICSLNLFHFYDFNEKIFKIDKEDKNIKDDAMNFIKNNDYLYSNNGFYHTDAQHIMFNKLTRIKNVKIIDTIQK